MAARPNGHTAALVMAARARLGAAGALEMAARACLELPWRSKRKIVDRARPGNWLLEPVSEPQ